VREQSRDWSQRQCDNVTNLILLEREHRIEFSALLISLCLLRVVVPDSCSVVKECFALVENVSCFLINFVFHVVNNNKIQSKLFDQEVDLPHHELLHRDFSLSFAYSQHAQTAFFPSLPFRMILHLLWQLTTKL